MRDHHGAAAGALRDMVERRAGAGEALLVRLTAGRARAPRRGAEVFRIAGADEVERQAVPFAAVELNQVAQHAGRGRVSGDARGGLPGAQQRAGVHGLNASAGEEAAKCPGLRKPVRAQRQVQALPQTQLLACRSVRLRVANQVDELFGHGDCPPFKICAPPMPWGRRLAKRLLTDAPRTDKIIVSSSPPS